MNILSSARRILAPSIVALSLVALAGCGEEGAADKVTKATDEGIKQGTDAVKPSVKKPRPPCRKRNRK